MSAMTIPPKGTMLRNQLELQVHLRRVRRAFLSEPQVVQLVAILRRAPWWLPHAFSMAFMVWALWYGDTGWMIAAGLYALWIAWLGFKGTDR